MLVLDDVAASACAGLLGLAKASFLRAEDSDAAHNTCDICSVGRLAGVNVYAWADAPALWQQEGLSKAEARARSL